MSDEFPGWFWPEDVEADFGGPEEFGVEIGIVERDGFRIGQRVGVTRDWSNPQTGFETAFEGDQGTVLGFVPASDGGGVFDLAPIGGTVLVQWDDMDPDKIAADALILL